MPRCVDRVSREVGARMPARSVCLVILSLSEAGPGRFGRQLSFTDIYHAMPYRAKVLLLHRTFIPQVTSSHCTPL